MHSFGTFSRTQQLKFRQSSRFSQCFKEKFDLFSFNCVGYSPWEKLSERSHFCWKEWRIVNRYIPCGPWRTSHVWKVVMCKTLEVMKWIKVLLIPEKQKYFHDFYSIFWALELSVNCNLRKYVTSNAWKGLKTSKKIISNLVTQTNIIPLKS